MAESWALLKGRDSAGKGAWEKEEDQDLQGIKEWHLQLINREQNGAADMLARSTTHQHGTIWVNHPSEELLGNLTDDNLGIPMWRHSEMTN
nr:RING-H2 finger protein ATL67-like [Ipomoea batatas]